MVMSVDHLILVVSREPLSLRFAGSKGRGRPLKAWNDCVKNDILKRGLLDADL